MAVHFTFYVTIYGSKLNTVTATPLTDISELEAMVTAGTAVKMKVGIAKLNPDEDFDGDVLKMAGGVMVEEYNVYEIYSMEVFPFNWDDSTLDPEDQWDEVKRRELLKIMRYPYKWMDLAGYPNAPWQPDPAKAIAFVRENHSTSDPESGTGRRTVEFDLRKRQPEDDL